MACVTDCELLDLNTSTECNIKGGIKIIFWNLYANIDFATMAGDPLQFDPATQDILGYTILNANLFRTIEFERKSSFYTATFTEDAGVYEQLITVVFEGKGIGLRNALCTTISCCKIILHIYDNNCDGRVFGVEWDGSVFSLQIKTLRIVRHLDASGQLGSDIARDEVDFGGESDCPPLYSSITQADFVANYAA